MASSAFHQLNGKWICERKSKVCKEIQSTTKCFCDHDFKSHSINPKNPAKVLCTMPSCPCPHFSYVPSQGNLSFKCSCSHSHKLHDPISRRCTYLNCGACNRGFYTSYVCANCSVAFMEHILVFEPKNTQSKAASIISQQEQQSQLLKNSHHKNRFSNEDGLWSNEDIDDAEVQRRKSLPKQTHAYSSSTLDEYGRSSQNNSSLFHGGDSESIRIKKEWNPATISIEENGRKIELKTHLQNQAISDEMRAQLNSKMDMQAVQKANSRKNALKRVNEKAKEEHNRLVEKYGEVIYDENHDEFKEKYESQQSKHSIDLHEGECDFSLSALKLFHTPNKYSLQAYQFLKRNLILLEAEQFFIPASKS